MEGTQRIFEDHDKSIFNLLVVLFFIDMNKNNIYNNEGKYSWKFFEGTNDSHIRRVVNLLQVRRVASLIKIVVTNASDS